ncbi:small ribosomal subunit Rsm22 family protein [Halohasta salina]|uniref:small ribosomal subunit Rsm22 family protein n=1 Tax=Halohasta salina TaxID=2961621 RepID=UPI0020A25169|nr:methyltransferase domain-containing protein [Halohasta salina]
MIDRQSVRDNAKYLQSVRPIDPEEICEYIDGQPHPAVVKQTLREEAFDLGLVEQEDGTFVPVEEEPVDYRRWNPEAFPEAYSFALEDQLVKRYGANWHRGESGRELRERITQLKEDYFGGADVEYDETAALGYAIYHLPDYYAAIGYVLDLLTERGLLDRTLRVLDVGAGSGGPALGFHDYLFGSGERADPTAALVDYHAVEPSASADVLDSMLGETTRNFHTTIHRSTIEAYLDDQEADDEPAEAFDLICFGNVLSELDDPVAVVDAAFDLLADDGTVLALEPADLDTATGLRAIERAVASPESDVTIYAPTLRLWDGQAPDDRGWSFDVRDDIAEPPFQHRLAEGQSTDEGETDSGAFVNVDVQFAYSLLRTDGERRFPVRANRKRHAPLSTMDDHVTDRINLLAVKLSHNLSEGDNPLFLVGDGSQQVDHYAVLTRESGLNRDLAAAPYGAVLEFENVLALWNDDEGAYNLVVDAETVVDAVAGY